MSDQHQKYRLPNPSSTLELPKSYTLCDYGETVSQMTSQNSFLKTSKRLLRQVVTASVTSDSWH